MANSVLYVYFNLRGLGEGIRMLLNLCKIEYEEKRIDAFNNEWQTFKEEAPLNQLPYLDIDGMRLHQSRAICRYLARKIDLDGSNDRERVYIDMASEVLYDLLMKLRVLRDIEDPDAKERKFNQLNKTVIPKYLKELDETVKNNGGYFANGKLSWLDLYFAGAHDYISTEVRFNIGEAYPNLKSVVDKVHNYPNLQEYLKKRPTTMF